MSILIKGLDMPKEGESVCITIWSDSIVYARKVETDEDIDSELEAIQIPTPHGRIVDISNVDVKEDVYYQCYRVDAPTILEAEE